MSIVQKVVGVGVALGMCLAANANEYDDSWIVPRVTAIVFSPHQVGLKIRPTDRELMLPVDQDYDRFFVVDRSDGDFRLVSEAAFENLLSGSHLFKWVFSYEEAIVDGTRNGVSAHSSDTDCDEGSLVRTEIAFGSLAFEVRLECKAIVTDATVIDDELWVVAYRWRTHGAVNDAGVVDVFSLDGTRKKSIEIGSDAVLAVAEDPWSTNTWIVGYGGLSVITSGNCIAKRYWPVHRIDERGPNVFVDAVEQRPESDPLALLAYSVGEDNFQRFLELFSERSTAMRGFDLYSYYMQGSRTAMADKASSWLNYVEPSETWRQFACLLPYENARELCGLAPDDWPR